MIRFLERFSSTSILLEGYSRVTEVNYCWDPLRGNDFVPLIGNESVFYASLFAGSGSLSSTDLTVIRIASSLVYFGRHPLDLSLLTSSSIFLTSPFHPLPSSVPPVNSMGMSSTPDSASMIRATALTSIWSEEPTLKTLRDFCEDWTEWMIPDMQSSMYRYDLIWRPLPRTLSPRGRFLIWAKRSLIIPCLLLGPMTFASLRIIPVIP